MMLAKIVITLLLACAFAFDCCSAQPAEIGTEKSASPLTDYQLGKKWVYRKTKASGEKKPSIETSEVVGVHLFDGQKWVLLNDFGMAIWSRVAEDGVHDAMVELDDDTLLLKKVESHLFFKYPTRAGDELATTYQAEQEFGGGTWVKTASTDTKVETPAGKFSCTVYEIWSQDTEDDPRKLIMTHYLCPGTGIVKLEETAEYSDDGIPSTWELLRIESGKEVPANKSQSPR